MRPSSHQIEQCEQDDANRAGGLPPDHPDEPPGTKGDSFCPAIIRPSTQGRGGGHAARAKAGGRRAFIASRKLSSRPPDVLWIDLPRGVPAAHEGCCRMDPAASESSPPIRVHSMLAPCGNVVLLLRGACRCDLSPVSNKTKLAAALALSAARVGAGTVRSNQPSPASRFSPGGTAKLAKLIKL